MCLSAKGQPSPLTVSRERRAVVNSTDPELRSGLNLASPTPSLCHLGGLGADPLNFPDSGGNGVAVCGVVVRVKRGRTHKARSRVFGT